MLLIALVATMAAQVVVLRRSRFDWFVVAIVLGGTVLSANYLTYTSISERNYDAPSHLEYIQWIGEHGRVPDVFACGVCGHPPLYYALAAFWSEVVVTGEWMPRELGLQWLSLLLFSAFVFLALLIFRSCGLRAASLRLATALVVFWPSSIINSVRVHNDALASLAMLAAMYFTAQWDRHERRHDFYAALAACALALLTKTSGLALATLLLIFVGARVVSSHFSRASLLRLTAALGVLCTVAVLSVVLRDSRDATTLCQKIAGHACDGRYVSPVQDTLARYVLFDVKDFVLRMDTVLVDPERDYYLNRLAKSSLYGVMPLGDDFADSRHEALAVLMNAALLSMCAGSVLTLPFLRNVNLKKYRVYLAAALVLFVFLLAFRVRVPNEFHEDFRHIYPALVPFSLGYVTVVERLGRSCHRLRDVGRLIGWLLIASSIVFFARLP